MVNSELGRTAMPKPNPTPVSRATLYAQVWARPMSQVAKDYGLSNVGLAKICAKIDVPVPGRGYWAKVKTGKPVTKKPLPALKEGQPDQVLIGSGQGQGGAIENRPRWLPK